MDFRGVLPLERHPWGPHGMYVCLHTCSSWFILMHLVIWSDWGVLTWDFCFSYVGPVPSARHMPPMVLGCHIQIPTTKVVGEVAEADHGQSSLRGEVRLAQELGDVVGPSWLARESKAKRVLSVVQE